MRSTECPFRTFKFTVMWGNISRRSRTVYDEMENETMTCAKRCVSWRMYNDAAAADTATVRSVVKGEMSAKTTHQRSAKGPTSIGDCAPDGKFITLENTGRKVCAVHCTSSTVHAQRTSVCLSVCLSIHVSLCCCCCCCRRRHTHARAHSVSECAPRQRDDLLRRCSKDV